MDGRHHVWRERRRHELAALLRHAKSAPEQRLRSRGSKAHDHERVHEIDLHPEPWTARVDLGRTRTPVEPPLPAWFPFEMLDRIRHVDLVAFDAGGLERTIQQSPGRADERPPGAVLLITG